jgi:hypothetical protein
MMRTDSAQSSGISRSPESTRTRREPLLIPRSQVRILPGPSESWGYSWITAMFLHGSWGHILGNMLFLAVFGKNVEDAFGHLRYLIFYFAGGFVAIMTQSFFTLAFGNAADARVPNLGASGAIAGALGSAVRGELRAVQRHGERRRHGLLRARRRLRVRGLSGQAAGAGGPVGTPGTGRAVARSGLGLDRQDPGAPGAGWRIHVDLVAHLLSEQGTTGG